MKRIVAVLVLGVCFVLSGPLGCSGESQGPGDQGSGDSDQAGDQDSGDGNNCAVAFVETVSGTIYDGEGNPLPGAKAQACVRAVGADLPNCITPVTADAQGEFEIAIPSTNNVQCMEYLVLRYLLDASHVITYCEADLEGAVPALELDFNPRLYDTELAIETVDLGNDKSRLIFSDGLEIEVDGEDFFGDIENLETKRFSPDADGLCFVHEPSDYYAIYGFAPEGDVVGDTFPVTIPNTTELPADTVVQLYALGGLDCKVDGDRLEEGEWGEIGTATVSSDGLTIEGGELPCLYWFAYGPAL